MRFLTSAIIVLLLLANPVSSLALGADTDGDGMEDQAEDVNGNGVVDEGETDPRNADTDDGGEADGAEVLAGRDPLDGTDDMPADRDGDGLTNYTEIQQGTDWQNADTDGDGVPDNRDLFPTEPAYSQDSDGDSIPNTYEVRYEGLAPNNPADAEEDYDGDGLSNLTEYRYGTNPNSSDTDRDGRSDGNEVRDGSDPQESPCLLYTTPTTAFSDIEWHWAKEYVEHLQRTKILPEGQRIVEGYELPDRRIFLPNQHITRFEFLKLALMSSCIKLIDGAERMAFSFTDVPNGPRPREEEGRTLRRRVIYTGVQHLIVEGYPDGSFKPDQPVNRAEALKILMESARLEPLQDIPVLKKFPDVISTEWYHSYVRKALAYEMVEGYPDGTFRPGQFITRAEAAKIVWLLMLNNPHVNGYVLPNE